MTRRPRARAVRAPRRRRLWLPLTLGALSVAAAVGIGVYVAPGPPARQGAATTVVLAQGEGLPKIAGDLARAGVIRSSLLFMVAAKLTGAAGVLEAGEYAFPSRASMARVLAALRKGEVVRHVVTIPEGFTSAEAAAAVEASPVLTGAVSAPPEGSLLPETYRVNRGESRADVIARMRAARDALLARLWASRRPGLPYRSPEQAVILASIVEKETAKPDERAHVAAVFLNRMAEGMRLDSDPTVVYGLTGGTPLGHGLKVSELASRTPYNTYVIAGLPPTPIANPGRASLEAALAPARSRDLYFVANGTGGHVFSATLAEHEKNVARWRAIEAARAGGGRHT